MTLCCALFMLTGTHAKTCPAEVEEALDRAATPTTLVPRDPNGPPPLACGRIAWALHNKPPGKAS